MFLRPVRKVEHLTLYSEVAGDTSWPTGKKKEKERIEVKEKETFALEVKAVASQRCAHPTAPYRLHPALTALYQGSLKNPAAGACQAPDVSVTLQGEPNASQVQALIAGEIKQRISIPPSQKHGPRLAEFLV